jgi:hypothetical protein
LQILIKSFDNRSTIVQHQRRMIKSAPTTVVTVSGVPATVVAVLREQAKENNRSLAGEIRALLAQWVGLQKEASK